MGQGFAALGAQRVGLVENGGDAALFGEWRNFYWLSMNEVPIQSWNTGTLREALQTERLEQVINPARFVPMEIGYIQGSIEWPVIALNKMDFPNCSASASNNARSLAFGNSMKTYGAISCENRKLALCAVLNGEVVSTLQGCNFN